MELGGIALEPVRGSDEDREIQAKRESLLGGHELSEVLDCEGRVRRAPQK